ncbi:sensor histidine kinase [Georgfuchsia toluolica]|nr:histidine kinase [Georgfuchsia toluolica]
MTLRLLQIEDSQDDADLVCNALEAGGFAIEAHRIESEAEMIVALRQGGWNLIICDYSLQQFSAQRALDILSDWGQEVPFIITSNMVCEEVAAVLTRSGATNFTMKSNLEQLPGVVKLELRKCAAHKGHHMATTALQESEARYRMIAANLPGMVYQSLVLRDGDIWFLYVSDQCKPLLGIEAEMLKESSAHLFDLVVPEDRASLHQMYSNILNGQATVNWEGRFRIPSYQDIKWINIRANNREMPSGGILSDGIMSNITKNRTLQLDLMRSQEQLRELSSHLQFAKEQERARIARELHDDLGSTLTAIKIDLMRLRGGLPAERADLAQKIDSASSLLDHAMDTVRNVSQSLRPGILDYGLQAAIEWQTQEFEERLGITCELHCHADIVSLDADASTALFRIFQETLTNISKHANATKVIVTLIGDDEMVLLEVEDNGHGIATRDMDKVGSFGIRNMRERVGALGGEIEIEGNVDRGTRVCVTIPLPSAIIESDQADTQQMLF